MHVRSPQKAKANLRMEQRASLPVIDISSLFSNSENANSMATESEAVVSALAAAVTTHGIFAITGHGIPIAIIDAALAATKSSLESDGPAEAESWEEHEKIVSTRLPGELKNYSPAGVENVGRFYNGKADAPTESVAKFTVFPPNWERDPMLPERQHNVWPPTSSGILFRQALETYYEHVQGVSDILHSALAQSIGKKSSFIKDMMGPYGHGLLRALHYNCHTDQADVDGQSAPAMAAHKDLGTTTLLVSDAMGLQFQPRGTHEWIDVVVPHGAIVVNLGEFFEVWTGGAWHATLHRVSASGRQGRTSLAFFSNQAIPLPRDGSAPENRTIAPLEEIDVVGQGADKNAEWIGVGRYNGSDAQKTVGWPSYFFDRLNSLFQAAECSTQGGNDAARAGK